MRVEHAYDVPPRALFDLLTDETFLAARSERFGGSGPPTVDRREGTAVVTVPRRLPVDAVPAPFRGLVGSGDLVQTDAWTEMSEKRIAGAWTTDVGDAPMTLHGTHEITATSDGCRYVVTAHVRVKVRLIGGQAERMVSQRLAELVDKEQQFAEEWLRDHA